MLIYSKLNIYIYLKHILKMSDELEGDSELLALRNELLKGLNKKSPIAKTIEKLNDDDELERLRLQALDAKRVQQEKNIDSQNKKNQLPGRFRYERKSEDDDDDENDDELKPYEDRSDQENDKQVEKNDNFKDKYQKYRDRCTKIMSNVAYEPDMIKTNLKETLNNLDLRRLLREKIDENEMHNDAKKTDLILEQLDYAYAPITKPICIKRNEIYINANFRPKIDYQRSYSKNGETKYWKNDNNYHKGGHDDAKSSDDCNEANFDDDDDFKSNKKLKSIVVQQVINTSSKRDDSSRSLNPYNSMYKRRRRYDSSSSR